MKRFFQLVAIAGALVLSASATPASAQDCLGHPRQTSVGIFSGAYGGGYYWLDGLAVAGSTVYRLQAPEGISAFNYASGAFTSKFDIPVADTAALDPIVVGNFLAAIQYDGQGVNVYDISSETTPKFLTALRSDAWCLDDACAEAAGIQWYTASDGSPLGTSLATDGTYLYMSYVGYDSADDSTWVGVQKWALASTGATMMGEFRTGMSDDATGEGSIFLSGLAVSGGNVYLGHAWYANADDADGQFRVAIADTATMTMVADASNLGTAGIPSGQYDGGVDDGLIVDGTRLYVADGNAGKILVFDVSNPAAVTKVGESAKVTTGIHGRLELLDCGSTHYLIANDAKGDFAQKAILIFSLANPNNPALKVTYKTEIDNATGGIAISDDCKTMFVTGSIGPAESSVNFLDAIDMTNPEAPAQITRLAQPSGGLFLRFVATKADGTYTYIANNSTQKGVTIVDTRNVDNPKDIKQFSVGHQVRTVAMLKDDVFVAGAQGAISFWDASTTPETPVKLKAFAFTAEKPVEDADYFPAKDLLVISAKGAAILYNVADPKNPVELARLSTGADQAYGAFVDGNRLAVAHDAGFSIFDITNPAAPTKIGTKRNLTTPGGTTAIVAIDVAIRGDYAYVANFDSTQVTIVRIAGAAADWTQTNAVLFGDEADPDTIRVITVRGDLLYVPHVGAIRVFDLAASPTFSSQDDAIEVIPQVGQVRGLEWRPEGELRSANTSVFTITWMNECAIAGFTYDVVGATGHCAAIDVSDTSEGEDAHAFGFPNMEMSNDVDASYVVDAIGHYPITSYAFTNMGLGADAAFANVAVDACDGVTVTPSIDITAPAGGAVSGTVSFRVTVADWVLDCAAIGGANVAGHGHFHVLIDGVYEKAVCTTDFTLDACADLGNGNHTVSVVLANNDHTTLTNAEAMDSVALSVSDCPTGCTYAPSQAVAGVSRSGGANESFFRTSFWMTNPSETTPLAVQLSYFTRNNSSMGGAAPMVSVTIPANSTMAYDDVLTELFGATSDTTGVVFVETCDGAAGAQPIVTSRTYNDSAIGTFGQYIPAVMVSSAGETTNLYGLGSVSGVSRSNIGVVNLTGGDMSYIVRLWNANGTQLGGDQTRTISAHGIDQFNASLILGGADTALFSASIESASGFFAYSSKLDAVTNDPIFIPAGLEAHTTQWIDGVASSEGSNNTYFKSNLLLANTSGSEATVSISFTKRNETASAGTASVTLAAGQSMFYADAVSELFTMTGVAGQLMITSNVGIVAWARTYNDASVNGGTGTYGQFIPAFDMDDLIDTMGGTLQGLSHNDDFRTNLGLVNTSSSVVMVTIGAYGANGMPLSTEPIHIELQPGQAQFKGNILTMFGVTSADDVYLEIYPGANDAVYVWASVVDNHSSDPTFVRPNYYMAP